MPAVELYVPSSLRHFEPKWPLPTHPSHAPFEYDLVCALRPRLVVDLGAGPCASFFVFCQSMRDHDVDGSVYGIDEWESAVEGATRFDDVNAHARQFHLGVAYLTRMAPANGLAHFAERSIDLLRIDGGRSAVELGAIDAWMSRLSEGGALLVHGIETETGRALWDRRGEGRAAFELEGLGVGLGEGGGKDDPLVRLLRRPEEHDDLRRFYVHAGEHHRLRRETDPAAYLGRKKPAR